MARLSLAAKQSADLGLVQAVARPAPPEELTVEQAAEWRAVVEALPADWFRPESHGLLVQYVRHRVAARRIATLVALAEAEEEFDFGEYDKLLKAQEREGRAISSLATRMRLSQQATYDKTKGKGRAARGKRPWEAV